MQVPGSANALMLGGNPDAGYTIARSLRLRRSASAYLNRTPSTSGTGAGLLWTASFWIKRGAFTTGSSYQELFTGKSGASTYGYFGFDASDCFVFNQSNSGSFQALTTSQVFRDPSSWYHIVIAYDSAQATASNRVKMYVNGVQITAFSTATYPPQNSVCRIMNANATYIATFDGTSEWFDGYMTETNFIDGQALTPSSFGETDTVTGVWKPKQYTGTYGTNGFYLNFSDNSAATAAAIGKDYSGNGNNWTPNNISVTSGATYDSMTDVPTLTSATAANYPVINILAASQPVTISNANLTIACGNGSTYGNSTATIPFPSSGKYYFEAVCTQNAAQGAFGLQSIPGSGTTRLEWYATGTVYYNGTSANVSTYSTNDVLALAVDVGDGTIGLYKNGTLQNTITYDISALTLFPYFTTGYSNTVVTWSANFGQRPFAYTPPTGFVALNTFNLPDPTIKKGSENFDVVTRSGFGTGGGSINSLSFKPDFFWEKARNNAYNHQLVDSVRGVSKVLNSNLTDAENTQATYVTSFNSNGYTTGSNDYGTSVTLVDWVWKANGAAVSNTAGSITSQVSANASAGFSVVTYTGVNSGTVGHGLGVAPSMIITKSRTNGSAAWAVYTKKTGKDQLLALNSTGAASTLSNFWGSSEPTSTVFGIYSSASANNAGDMVAYCFAEVAGYSKFGSYVGNGSTDGTFVHLGFRPKFILTKLVGGVDQWYILDSARDTYNVSGLDLAPNQPTAEVNDKPVIDFLSNGYKLRCTYGSYNGSGSTYIFAAFAENPFKYSLAR